MSNPKALTESVLRSLTCDAVTTFLGEAERFESSGSPGLRLALSNEPIVDMNMLVAGASADPSAFEAAARSCLERSIPFISVLFPSAPSELEERAAALGLAFAVEFPFMVYSGGRLDPGGNTCGV